MDTSNPLFGQGMAFFAIGIALLIVLDFWIAGVGFMFMGAHRLYVLYQQSADQQP